jgi:FkbM family methyltransferase
VNVGPLNTFWFLLRHPLTGHRPLRALARWLRWQIGSRILAGPIAVPFVNDARLLVRRGMTGATGNVYAGLHEFEDMSFVLHALLPDDLFVDVGANVGTYSVLASKVAGARVVAFEPIASTCLALRDNLALNDIVDRVEVWESCVGSTRGAIRMTTQHDTTNHVVTAASEGPALETSQEVPLVPLDEAIGARRPFMLKLDVEGYELEVLRGAKRTLADPGLQCVILEINAMGERYERSDAELSTLLVAQGFALHAYEPRQRRLVPQAAHARGSNAIFVRDLGLVQARVAAAPRFRVLDQEI